MYALFLWILFSTLSFSNENPLVGADLYKTSNGKVNFASSAQLEVIKAQAATLKGGIDLSKQAFAFSIVMNSFEGFNSPLQRTHFNENYLETALYPTATFEGKILNKGGLEKDGLYLVKTVGKFKIHGISQEKMIEGKLIKKGKSIKIEANFPVNIADFNIPIPKIVEFKIAKTVNVQVEAELKHE